MPRANRRLAVLGAHFYEALVLIVVGLLLGGGAALAGLIARHALITLQLHWRERRMEVLLPLLAAAIDDPDRRSPLLAGLRAGDLAVVLPMLLQLSLDLRGEERERVSRLAEQIGVAASELRRLGSFRSLARAEAAKNLGLLRVRAALPALLLRVDHDRDRSVRLACARAIGEIGGPEAVRGLLGLLDDPAPGIVRRVQEVLLETAPGAVLEIVRHARAASSDGVRCAAVELLGALRDPLASDLLLEMVAAPDVELRTKAAKAAAAIGDPRFGAAFARLMRDPAWPVRCQAATGLGAAGVVDAVPVLREAMADAVWWVRFNAACSLAELGRVGRAALTEATSDGDGRRRDVARYVLQRTRRVPLAA